MEKKRTINETHIIKDMSLPFIFYHSFLRGPRLPGPRNWHENIELLYFMDGTGAVQYHEDVIEVGAGDLVVVNANVPHAVFAKSAVLECCCLIVDRGFCLANGIDTNKLQFEILVREEVIKDAMMQLMAEYEATESDFRTPAIRAHVLNMLVVLSREHSRPGVLSQTSSHLLSCIQTAIGHIRVDYAKDLSLDEIAARVGVSKYYFSREFRRVTGYPFVSYVNMVRCEEAKRLLSQTHMRVGEIAEVCGFANQSYFTRTFYGITGLRPLAYREKKQKS